MLLKGYDNRHFTSTCGLPRTSTKSAEGRDEKQHFHSLGNLKTITKIATCNPKRPKMAGTGHCD